jgi:2-amino-4-hydroxy-6-hydroxymethyldihydropteridine diphosphokinase / dihydropteroate synthase
MSKTTVIVGLGSNVSALTNLRIAVRELKKIFKLNKISSIYESDAQVLPNSPSDYNQKYLNAAVLIEAENFDPYLFLAELKKIEKKMGRQILDKWAPREIDLDILYVDGFKLESNELNIPHKSLSERPFALLPALDVFPDLQVEKPIWCDGWVQVKPFNTVKSKNYFWPEFVGILNVTPDSFSDGGKFLAEDNFKQQASNLVASGAGILDLGAESTRPNAVGIDFKTEFQRLHQALNWLNELKLEIKISIDTRNPDVLTKVLQNHDIDFLNDVTGFENSQMLNILKVTKMSAVVMHSITIPPYQTQTLKMDENPNSQLICWWGKKIEIFEQNNIDLSRLIFDPGIGFGKTPQQNSYILNHLDEVEDIQQDIYLGFSRKSYLNQYANQPAHQKDLATALQLSKINLLYCQYLRTHDIESQKTALGMK